MPDKKNYPKFFSPFSAPTKPREPNKELCRHGGSIDVCNYSNFVLNGKEYTIEISSNYDDAYEATITELVPEENSKYPIELEKYNKELEKYNLEHQEWKANVKRWKEEEKLEKDAEEYRLYEKLKQKYES